MKSVKRRVLTELVLLFFLFMPLFSKEISSALRSCFDTIATSVFPSLFPYMIFGALLTDLCRETPSAKFIDTCMKKLFSLPGNAWAPLFVSALCGFPTGALCISQAYREKSLDRATAKQLLNCFTMPSPAFCISYLGVGVFDSKKIGFFLYLSCFFTSFFLLLLSGKIRPFRSKQLLIPPSDTPETPRQKSEGLFSLLLKSFRRSAGAFALLCSTLAALSVISVFFEFMLSFFEVNQEIKHALCCLTDLISGCRKLAVFPQNTALILCAFFLSFQGFGIYLQSYPAHIELNLKSSEFWGWRVLSGIISIVFMNIFINFL